jgi:hypothetical protein
MHRITDVLDQVTKEIQLATKGVDILTASLLGLQSFVKGRVYLEKRGGSEIE